MGEYEITVTITLVYTTKATSKDMALHDARTIDDAELFGIADQIDYDYKVIEVA